MKIIKKIGIIFSIIFFVSAANAETLRIAGNFAADHSSSGARNKFSDVVSKLTGVIVILVGFRAMQRGGAKENVGAVG